VTGGSRPTRLVLVAGTATEVGKTWVGATLARRLRAQGRTVAARKPAQSFDPTGSTDPTDAEVLAEATGEPAHTVCPPHRWYPTALAPPMAAEVLGRPPVRLADLLGELAWPTSAVDVGLVEPAGGVRSPLAVDGDTVDLADALVPDLTVLVADAGLGTINAVRLAAAALGDHPTVVLLNRFDPAHDLHRRNASWLRDDGLAVDTAVDELAGAVAGDR
jgi:dethiobiotin synthetase